MAYTIPKTWAYKETLSSADLNTYLRDNILSHEARLILEHDSTGKHTTAFSLLDTDPTLAGNSDAKIASQKAMKTFVQALYPVGSIYISTVSTNPNTLFGFGTWTAFAAGRTLIGVGTSDQAFAAAATGGASSVSLQHSHTVNSHTHDINDIFSSASSVTSGRAYGAGTSVASATHPTNATAPGTDNQLSTTQSVLQPYIVTYMWQRTA